MSPRCVRDARLWRVDPALSAIICRSSLLGCGGKADRPPPGRRARIAFQARRITIPLQPSPEFSAERADLAAKFDLVCSTDATRGGSSRRGFARRIRLDRASGPISSALSGSSIKRSVTSGAGQPVAAGGPVATTGLEKLLPSTSLEIEIRQSGHQSGCS